MRMMGAIHRCVPCGKNFVLKGSLSGHAEYCDYQARVNMDDLRITNPKPEKIKKKEVVLVDIELADDTSNLGPKFTEWIELLLSHIKKDGFLKDKSINDLYTEMKNNFNDYGLVDLFKMANKITNSSPKYKVQL